MSHLVSSTSRRNRSYNTHDASITVVNGVHANFFKKCKRKSEICSAIKAHSFDISFLHSKKQKQKQKTTTLPLAQMESTVTVA